MPYHVSKAEFGRLVEQALAELPAQFAEALEEVPVEIRDRPSRWLLEREGIEDGRSLLGIYQGANLLNRIEAEGRGSPVPNHILIFQDNIERMSRNEEDLVREIRITVLHELGHHFGLDEDDLEELGYE